MMAIFDDNENMIEKNKLAFISDKGQESIVYKYNNEVIKIFKKDYRLKHNTKEEIDYLKSIKTKRILMPTGYLKDEENRLIGYKMDYICGGKDINEEDTSNVITELETLREDTEILSGKKVQLFDINLSNTIFNGKIFLVDPGNYIVKEDDKDINAWNYDKINKLMDEMLFLNKFNLYQLRMIIQFFMKEKEKEGTNCNLDIIKQYFDPSLKIKDSISKFVKDNIKDDPKEKQFFEKMMNEYER